MNDRAKPAASLREAVERHEELPFRNPMGYWCAPNGATPKYVPSYDIRAFIAYGLLECYVSEEDTCLVYTPDDCWQAREQFLNTVENAIKLYDEWPKAKRHIQDEALEPRLYLPDKNDHEHDGACADWYLDMIADDGHLCFTWIWSGADDVAIWLAGETLDTPNKRREALRAVAEARTLITHLKGGQRPQVSEGLMTRNEAQLHRIAAEIARSDRKISKAFARERIRLTEWEKDGGTQQERIVVVCNLAYATRVKQDQRRAARGSKKMDTLQERLVKEKRRKFFRCVQAAGFRTATAGDHNTFLYFVTNPERVKAVSWTGEGRRYSEKQAFRRTDSEHRFFIRDDWTSTVEARGLAFLNGLLTLWVGPAEEVSVLDKPAHVYNAVWAGQGVGFHLNCERGYLAVQEKSAYHAESKEEAVAGLVRKIESSQKAPHRKPLKLEAMEKLFGDARIELSEAGLVGSSRAGTRAWCHRVGIDPDKPLTLADLIRGYRLETNADVLELIHHVVCRAGNGPCP
jgi:hypothetical protein